MATYQEVSAATADDLRVLIDRLSDVEKNIRAGDIAAMPSMLENWGKWGQMLMIRLEHRTDEYRASQETASLRTPADRGCTTASSPGIRGRK